MITTKNPLPGNLYLVAHTGGIRNVLLYIHQDGSCSSAWASSDGKRLYRFRAFENPGAEGSDDWLYDIRMGGTTFKAVFVGRPRKQPHRITNAEIFDLYTKFNATHG
ncbi:hypothetical protein [Klebsiella phage vB_KpnS_SXFY507]|nr:hypothetical protein [Klebsiella phage vB_KpnS_SXFY507]